MPFTRYFAAIGSLLWAAAPVACLLTGWFVAVAEEVIAPAVESDSVAATSISQWIDQLGSAQFAQREAATRSLIEVGPAAIEPLIQSINRGDLEVTSRAIEIMRHVLASNDADAVAHAQNCLELLAEGSNIPVARLAECTLDFHLRGMSEAARKRLETLGAVIVEGFLSTGQRGLQVLLNNAWHGGIDDLRLLARVRGVLQLGVHGVQLDDASLAMLGRMRSVERIELYGTGASDKAVALLAEKLPAARIDFRKGGKLGVGGQPMIGPCLITHVQDGSAAAKAGIRLGDIVVAIDGEAVDDFEALTTKVGRHGPGEAVQIDLDRNTPGSDDKRISCSVQLDGW